MFEPRRWCALFINLHEITWVFFFHEERDFELLNSLMKNHKNVCYIEI